MDFSLSDEHAMLVDTVRSFVRRELMPFEDEVERAGEVRPELARQIRERAITAGLYAANLPTDVGGGGLDFLGLALLERELGATSWGLQTNVGRPSRILLACEGEQRERYLLPTARGELAECFALTEPDSGSDAPQGIRTRAEHDGDVWVLNGRKHFISNADVADVAIVFAVTGEDGTERGVRKRITAFLVDRGTPGFEVSLGARAVGHHGYHHCELTFTDCRISDGQILGAEGQGIDLANRWLHDGRVMVAANCVGRARRVLDLAVGWAADRKQFGKPIGSFQGVSFKLADMRTELEAAELLMLRTAWKLDRGEATDADCSMAKLYASEMLGRLTDNAVQVFGGMGVVEDAPIERFWRDARIERIWDGTSEIHRHVIARSMLRDRGA
ncbi:MAG: acyl-CoA dehydrogenase family protein [Actinomycetota bacterium]